MRVALATMDLPAVPELLASRVTVVSLVLLEPLEALVNPDLTDPPAPSADLETVESLAPLEMVVPSVLLVPVVPPAPLVPVERRVGLERKETEA